MYMHGNMAAHQQASLMQMNMMMGGGMGMGMGMQTPGFFVYAGNNISL